MTGLVSHPESRPSYVTASDSTGFSAEARGRPQHILCAARTRHFITNGASTIDNTDRTSNISAYWLVRRSVVASEAPPASEPPARPSARQTSHPSLKQPQQLPRRSRHPPCLLSRQSGACHTRRHLQSHSLDALDSMASDVAAPAAPIALVVRDPHLRPAKRRRYGPRRRPAACRHSTESSSCARQKELNTTQPPSAAVEGSTVRSSYRFNLQSVSCSTELAWPHV
eukprot:1908492-Prymnesium_polylepis.1